MSKVVFTAEQEAFIKEALLKQQAMIREVMEVAKQKYGDKFEDPSAWPAIQAEILAECKQRIKEPGFVEGEWPSGQVSAN